MATVSERIKALEAELQQLRGVEQWGQVGNEMRDFFKHKWEDVDETSFVIVMVETAAGVTVRDWKIPYRYACDTMAKAGSMMQQQLDTLTREKGGKH